MEEKEFGWICPKCGVGVSPREKVCPMCAMKEMTTITCGNLSSTDVEELLSRTRSMWPLSDNNKKILDKANNEK